MKKKKFDIEFFRKETPDKYYVLGFFTADGSLTKNSRGGHYFSIQSKDKQIIFDVKKSMQSEHKISVRLDTRTNNAFYRMQIGSRVLYEDLFNLGFTGNKTKNLPNFNIKKDLLCHFVRGYFDGDGNIWSGIIHKNRKTTHRNILLAFTSASLNFLEFLSDHLNQTINTKGSLYKGKANYYRLQYSKKDALKIYNFVYNINIPYLCLKRKKIAFDRAISKLE